MTTPTIIEDRRKAHAEKIGVDEDRIRTVRLDLERVRTLGTLVDIDVHGTSMFTRHTSMEEWGIPRSDVRALRLNHGSKDLIPKKYLGRLKSLEVRFRTSLVRHSFVLEGFTPYCWIPFTAYEDWKEEWDRLQVEWAEVKQEILDNYDELQLALRRDFIRIAAEAYTAIQARNPEFNEPWTTFVRRITRSVLAQFPSREKIGTGLWVDYKPALLVGAEEIEADLLARDHLRQIREQEAARARLEQQELQAQQRELWEQEEEQRKLREMRMKAEEERLRAMHETEMEKAREQLARTVSPWDELFQQLRAQMYEDTVSILTSIQKNGHLNTKVALKARNMVETFRMLNAHGDGELEQKLEELKAALASRTAGGSTVDLNQVYSALNEVKRATAEAAAEVRRRAEPGLWGALEV